MRVLLTGASGFIGRHVVSQLLAAGHSIIAIARNKESSRTHPWFKEVNFIESDLHDCSWHWNKDLTADVLVHLAWPGLPNYRDMFHIRENLPADLKFLESAIQFGIKHVVVAGTCLEYGMQCGPLQEHGVTQASTSYGLAKDTLRKSLEILQKRTPFTLQWARLFYMYGEGQNPNSLLAQLDRAIDEGQLTFKMSLGDQLRDYLPVSTIATYFQNLIENPKINGVINCSSGRPISILDLVNSHREKRKSNITLLRGHYAYPDYEPMAFWGVPKKLEQAGLLL